jgi:hypothetical protein
VAFVFALPDGRVVVAETSLDLFTTAAHGLRAAHENRGPDAEPVPTRPCDSPRGEPCRTPR